MTERKDCVVNTGDLTKFPLNGIEFFLCAGFNPVWYDTLRFTIHTPELAMVRFVVEDYEKTSKNDFVGQYVLPLRCMQQGNTGETSCTIHRLWLHVQLSWD